MNKDEIKIMKMEEVRAVVQEKIKMMQDLFAMDTDAMIQIARHYNWNEEKMSVDWFEHKSRLEHQLGITFDKSLDKKLSELKLSKP